MPLPALYSLKVLFIIFIKICRASLVAQFAVSRIRDFRSEQGTSPVPAGRSSVPAGRTSGVVSRRLGGAGRSSALDSRPSGVDSLPSGTPALSSGVSSRSSGTPALSSGVASRRLGFSRRRLRFSSQPSLNSLNTSKLPSPGLAATQSSVGVSPARRTSGYANQVAGAVGADRSAIAVHAASRRWLSFLR